MANETTRLRRISGQLAGIIRMMEEEQDCEKIIVQFQAAKAALDAAFAAVLTQQAERCLGTKDARTMKRLLALLTRRP